MQHQPTRSAARNATLVASLAWATLASGLAARASAQPIQQVRHEALHEQRAQVPEDLRDIRRLMWIRHTFNRAVETGDRRGERLAVRHLRRWVRSQLQEAELELGAKRVELADAIRAARRDQTPAADIRLQRARSEFRAARDILVAWERALRRVKAAATRGGRFERLQDFEFFDLARLERTEVRRGRRELRRQWRIERIDETPVFQPLRRPAAPERWERFDRPPPPR